MEGHKGDNRCQSQASTRAGALVHMCLHTHKQAYTCTHKPHTKSYDIGHTGNTLGPSIGRKGQLSGEWLLSRAKAECRIQEPLIFRVILSPQLALIWPLMVFPNGETIMPLSPAALGAGSMGAFQGKTS